MNSATTVFVTDAANREVLEYDGASGAILRWYAYGLGSNDVLNQMNVAAATRATLIPDIQGSVIASLDSGSGALSKIGYLPYGKSASAGPFGYTGQRIDTETNGLYYYRARHYSPVWGRFLQPDPIGYGAGSNLYAYVGNDPLNNIDPSGTIAFQLGGAAAGAVIGLGIQVGIDVWNWQVSSPSVYAGAIIGGAAGGVAATLCGTCAAVVAGSVSGAVGGGVSNFVANGLNGTLNATSLFADAASGAIGGAVVGHLAPAAFKSFVSNSVKGDIGEGLSEIGLRLAGQPFETRVLNSVPRSSFDFGLPNGSFVEAKFGTSKLSSAQKRAIAAGDEVETHYWNYPTVSGIGGAGEGAGVANLSSK